MPDLFAVVVAAFSAYYLKAERIETVAVITAQLSVFDFRLHLFPLFRADYRRVAFLNIILCDLALVFLHFLLKEIYCKRLLQYVITMTSFKFGSVILTLKATYIKHFGNNKSHKNKSGILDTMRVRIIIN